MRERQPQRAGPTASQLGSMYVEHVDLPEKARIVELAEAECLADGFACASEQLATVLGMSVDRLHGGVATVMRNDPTGGFWSRVIGLGIDAPVTDQVVQDVIASYDGRGASSICVQISPRPARKTGGGSSRVTASRRARIG